MAQQLLLWARSVMECQEVVSKAEFEMKKAKTKFLEKKHTFDAAAQELRTTLTTSPEDDDVSDSQATHGEIF